MDLEPIPRSEFERFEKAAIYWGEFLFGLKTKYPGLEIALDAEHYLDKLRMTATKIRQHVVMDVNR